MVFGSSDPDRTFDSPGQKSLCLLSLVNYRTTLGKTSFNPATSEQSQVKNKYRLPHTPSTLELGAFGTSQTSRIFLSPFFL